MKYFLFCALAICTISGLQAQSSASPTRVYSASLQNILPNTVTDVRSYLTHICEADSVIYSAATSNFEIYTKKALETSVIAGKLQKNFTPLTELRLKSVPAQLQQEDSRQAFEIITDLEFINEAPHNDFSKAKEITLHFEPFERRLNPEFPAKVAENLSACGEKLQVVSIENGSITFRYINQSVKEIMMYCRAKDLPALYYQATIASRYCLKNNSIEEVKQGQQ
jgi:hypothetical protein